MNTHFPSLDFDLGEDIDMLREAFANWEIESVREYEAMLDEGPKHSGMAALVDLVARKPLD